ncbi:MAG: aspartate kinase [Fervidobacterium sp.]|uniref:aspartate kinase n=1 Tax=Fervidobacterium sp. TaxID=1871331 RepID=UPI004049947F
MEGRFVVLKFGGSNFKDSEGYSEVKRKIGEVEKVFKDKHLVIVVSAAFGVTDKLLHALYNFRDQKADNIIDEIYEFHLHVLNNRTDSYFESLFKRIRELLIAARILNKVPPFLKDELLSYGERINAYTLLKVLKVEDGAFELKEADEWIITDGKFGNSTVLLEKTKQRIQSEIDRWNGVHSIVPGFYGRSVEGDVTLLGRGGSDYTATTLGYALGAESVFLFKDVNGFLSCNPKIVKSPQVVSYMSYDEADELSYFGAKVLQYNSIEPLRKSSIPLYVCSFDGVFDLNRCTRISDDKHVTESCVKSISYTDDVAVVQFKGRNLGRVPGVLGEISSKMAHGGVNIKFVITSQTSINLIVSKSALSDVLRIAETIRLDDIDEVSYKIDKALIALVGHGMLDKHGIAAKVFSVLADNGINIEMISAGSNDVSFYLIVNRKDLEDALRAIHKSLFENYVLSNAD